MVARHEQAMADFKARWLTRPSTTARELKCGPGATWGAIVACGTPQCVDDFVTTETVCAKEALPKQQRRA